jgi:hypothetical protein
MWVNDDRHDYLEYLRTIGGRKMKKDVDKEVFEKIVITHSNAEDYFDDEKGMPALDPREPWLFFEKANELPVCMKCGKEIPLKKDYFDYSGDRYDGNDVFVVIECALFRCGGRNVVENAGDRFKFVCQECMGIKL